MDAGPTLPELSAPQSRAVAWAIAGLGVSAIIAQLTLMREMLGVFCGNELILGIILGNWLFLTGLGAALGRSAGRWKNPGAILVTALVLIALLPPAQVFLLRVLRDVIFTRGAMIGVAQTVFSSFILLLPYCLVSGYLLTFGCYLLSLRKGPRGIAQGYLADCLGSLVGGVAFTFLLIHLCDHITLLCISSVIVLLLAGMVQETFGKKRSPVLSTLMVIGFVAVGLAWTAGLDAFSTALQYPGQTVLFQGHSPYGRLVVTRSFGQINFMENGVPTLSTGDPQRMEEMVHYALAQRPAAQEVLLIAGGVSGTTQEVLKYGGAQVTYVEQDPLILSAGRRFLPQHLNHPRLRVVNADGRTFVRQAGQNYDVIIVDVPDPATSQLNRFYTREFFQDVKRRLAPGGVLAIALGHYENRISPELGRMLASAGGTLRNGFANMLAIPGARVFLLASDSELHDDIARRVEQAGVQTKLMNRDYLDATLTPDRLAEVGRALHEPGAINADFNPVLYTYHLLYWISQFQVSFGVLEGLLLAALGVYLVGLKPVSAVIFASGFAASALEVVLLLALQVLCGTLYEQVGMVVTVFMAGLAAGAWGGDRWFLHSSRKALLGLAMALAVFAAGLSPLLMLLGRLGGASTSVLGWQAAIGALTFLLALLVGMQFPLAGRTSFRQGAETASRLYTADFMGACWGALLTSTLLIPILGVTVTCLAVGGLNVLAAAYLAFRKTT